MEPENNKTYMALTLMTFLAIIIGMVFLWMDVQQYQEEETVGEYNRNFFAR